MVLYLFRHGAAEETHPEGDKKRKLTPDGVKKVKKMGLYVKGRFQPDMVLTSPYARAAETAGIIAEATGYSTENILETPALIPDADILDIIAEAGHLAREHIFLIGHNPHLEDLCAALIGEGPVRVELKKSALAVIEFEGRVCKGAGKLTALIHPGILP